MLKKALLFALKVINKVKSPYVDNEHFVPLFGLDLEPYIQAHNVTASHHLIRYYWAREVIRNLSKNIAILDIACGSGYGSFIMAQGAPASSFWGVDYDKKAISKAKLKYNLNNLSFQFGDVLDWENTIGNTQFDVIVSFDTLEHVPHREIMMENIVRHLTPGGIFLLSTPCGLKENTLTPLWPSHKIEYSLPSLFDFLRRYFEEISRPDGENFPFSTILEELDNKGIIYDHRMNPVICKRPVRVTNPYKP